MELNSLFAGYFNVGKYERYFRRNGIGTECYPTIFRRIIIIHTKNFPVILNHTFKTINIQKLELKSIFK